MVRGSYWTEAIEEPPWGNFRGGSSVMLGNWLDACFALILTPLVFLR